ncbi:MAG: hypothetical protein H7Y38_13095 [Armatimonadetes bacterium]|nr:hypothetical protein [Armatimonadota bacterium]
MMQRITALLDAPGTGKTTPQIAEAVFEAMRVRLSAVMGGSGYATLLRRCFVLACRDFPWLAEIKPDVNGSLLGRLDDPTPGLHRDESARGFAAVLTQFATLLSTFIGQDLGDRLLGTVWLDLQDNTEQSGEGNTI